MFKEGEERNVETAISNIMDAIDVTQFGDELDVIRENIHNEDTSWKDKYESLKEDYTKRFKETFREPFVDPTKLDPDVHNTDTTFTEKDLLRFDFSGKNE